MRRRRFVLRRVVALAVVLVVVAAVVAVVLRDSDGGGGDRAKRSRGPSTVPARTPAASPASRLPLARRVGELLVMSFDGTTAPPYIVRRLRSGEGTGVILFGKNAPDAADTRRLTDSLQRAAGRRALIATDQEGGDIRSLAFSPPEASQARIGGPEAAKSSATNTANGLRLRGVNVNLAPVADVPDSLSSVVAGRAYAGGPEQVAQMVGAATGAYRVAGVASTAKHFPGLGRAVTNTDDQSSEIDASRADLLDSDLVPFTAAVRARTPLVMVGHALYPQLDRDRIASQSPAIVDGLLRGRLRYRGAVVTDSIEAQAVLDRGSIAAAAERSIGAGVDLILMTGSGSFNQIQPVLLRRARSDAAFRAKVTAAADRVLRLKRELRLRAPLLGP